MQHPCRSFINGPHCVLARAADGVSNDICCAGGAGAFVIGCELCIGGDDAQPGQVDPRRFRGDLQKHRIRALSKVCRAAVYNSGAVMIDLHKHGRSAGLIGGIHGVNHAG